MFKTGYTIVVTGYEVRVKTADVSNEFNALVNIKDDRHNEAVSHIYETALQQGFCAMDRPEDIPEQLRIEIRSGMSIPGHSHHWDPSTTICVRANQNFQDHPFLSDIVMQGRNACGNEEEWFPHVIALLHALDPAVDGFAYVRYYMIERVDDNTSLPE